MHLKIYEENHYKYETEKDSRYTEKASNLKATTAYLVVNYQFLYLSFICQYQLGH